MSLVINIALAIQISMPSGAMTTYILKHLFFVFEVMIASKIL